MSIGTEDKLAKLNELTKDIKIAMVTTRHGDHLHARPMATLEFNNSGELWFFASEKSDKVQDVSDSPQVNVTYSDFEHNKFVSISGPAKIVRDVDKNKQLWTPIAKAWFPDGPDDPDLVLMKVTIEHAEYWDGPSSKMVVLFSLIGSILKGKPFDAGENERLDL